ncbi:hypothetical protein C0989_009903 [Termitomyces sp. Mn162]|nr:hypothetical protein C0989_009903 [Termitomyces sp. Mn162]
MVHPPKQATRPSVSGAGTPVPPQQLPTRSEFGTLLQAQGGPIKSAADARRWLETKSWILAGEPYDRMKLARVLMAVVSSKGPRIDSEAKNAILAVALLMKEDAVNVHVESITEAIVSKLVERIEPVTHRVASSADFAAANGLAQAETTLTLKDVSTQLQSVTASLNEALAKTATRPQPATTLTRPTWADVARAKPLAVPTEYKPDLSFHAVRRDLRSL